MTTHTRTLMAKCAAWSFITSASVFILSFFIAKPPDISVDPPIIPMSLMITGQIATSFLIAASIIYATWLIEEKQSMASIGFTLMSVTQGIILVLYLISYNGREKMDEAYRMFSASLYLYIISMIFISVFAPFRKWLRLLSLVSLIPYIIENIIYWTNGKGFNMTVMIADSVGNILFNASVLLWGIFILKDIRRR